MPEAKETEEPPSRPPTISSNASQPGVPSSREYARCSPSTKFDAGNGGTFSGEPARRSRPAETSHDSTEPGLLALCPVVSLNVVAPSGIQDPWWPGRLAPAHGSSANLPYGNNASRTEPIGVRPQQHCQPSSHSW